MRSAYKKTLEFFYMCIIFFALAIPVKVVSISASYGNSNIFIAFLKKIQSTDLSTDIGIIIFIVLLYLFLKKTDFFRRKNIVIHYIILACFFGAYILIGQCFVKMENLNFIFSNKYQFFLAVVKYAGYSLLIYSAIIYLDNIFENKKDPVSKCRIITFYEKHIFLYSFILIVLLWMPYNIVFFPGSVPHDGYYQLNMFFKINGPSNHHPWFMTLIMGGVYKVGSLITDNMGVFTYIMFQTCICALIYAKMSVVIYKIKANSRYSFYTMLFYGLVPVFGAHSQAFLKDTLSSALFALFVLLIIEIMMFNRNITILELVELSTVSTICILSRNENIYVVIPTLILLAFAMNKKVRYLVSTLCVLIVVLLFNNVLLPAWNVAPGSKAESLSVIFQQTARYAIDYGDELSQSDIDTINNVLDYDVITKEYNPEISDYVKRTYKEPSKENMKRYMKLWFGCFVDHPIVYFEATLFNTFGYFDPEYNTNVLTPYQFYIKGEPVATGAMDIHYVFSDDVRNSLSEFADTARKFPVVSLFTNPGAYSWVILFLMVYVLKHKKYRNLIVFMPVILKLLTCVLSPVNGIIRYSLPLMAIAPILIYWSKYHCVKYIDKF